MNRRLIRLYNDHHEVLELIGNHPYIEIKDVMGNPPERYLIQYNVKGLVQNGREIVEKDSHLCEIILSGDYPRQEPICRLISLVVFHPNIAPNKICIADHWAAGESLTDIIIRIGEMICYQNYNIKSPLNGEAAKWAEEHIARFPVDNVNLEPARPQDETRQEEVPLQEIIDVQQRLMAEEMVIHGNCTNCGAGGESGQIFKCLNGHEVCADCIVECAGCSVKLCVLCPLIKCPDCGKILCAACSEVHPGVHKPAYQPGPAPVPLPDHPAINIKAGEIPGDRLQSSQKFDKQNSEPEPPVCSCCRNVIEDPDAFFCTMCGSRIRR